jgi:predicted RNase H-like nuclease (RuvC/YqgF family)
MNDAHELISGIEYKVRKLVNLQKENKSENELLLNQNTELKKNIEEQKKIINQLKEEFNKIKLAKSLESMKGSNDAKLKINELVREIDKCIELLSN